jgi:ubiquinone/menaquinone biosynthesis C-methylase UbiE
MMERGYQHEFSSKATTMYDISMRERKARTMVAVLTDYFDKPLSTLNALDVGSSTGIIDHYLSGFFGSVTGIDIDSGAVQHANQTYIKDNLKFQSADALNLPFPDSAFDAVICSQVYEHVPNAEKMMAEIHRVLKVGGVCYFAATNRLKLMEEHHHLPLLSVIPKWLAHPYLRIAGKGKFYYEQHLSYWGLRALTGKFHLTDYTLKTIVDPVKYGTDYMIRLSGFKARIGAALLKCCYWASPGYIWLLRKD